MTTFIRSMSILLAASGCDLGDEREVLRTLQADAALQARAGAATKRNFTDRAVISGSLQCH